MRLQLARKFFFRNVGVNLGKHYQAGVIDPPAAAASAVVRSEASPARAVEATDQADSSGDARRIRARQDVREGWSAEAGPGSEVRLVVISSPSLVSRPTRPRRLASVATVFAASSLLMLIGSLLLAAVREHIKV